MPISPYNSNFPGIYIDSPAKDPNFSSQARIALNIVRSRRLGADFLTTISHICEGRSATGGPSNAGTRRIVIEKAMAASASPADDVSDAAREAMAAPGMGYILSRTAFERAVRGQGGSAGAIARWNPANTIFGTTIERPSYIALIHELIHCLHFISGDTTRVITPMFNLAVDSPIAEEEARTVGIGPYDHPRLSERFCENAFRAAFGEPRRNEYQPGNNLSHVVRSNGRPDGWEAWRRRA